MVAATPSGWGGRVAGRTGVTLGTRLQSLNLWPGHPNCIEPGKRPRITLTPTIAVSGGKAVIGISIAGGDLQDQISLQLLLGNIEFGMEPAKLVRGPRFSTDHLTGSFRQPGPQLGSLKVYRALEKQTLEELARRGHRVRTVREAGNPNMITVDPKTGVIRAAGDPNAGRHSAAF